MSMCARRAPSAKRGGFPNWNTQLKRPPTMRTASAPPSAAERAAFMNIGWSSGIEPRPIGDDTNGMPRSTSRCSGSPASAQPAPFPMMTSGRSASASMSATAARASGSGWGREISGSLVRHCTSASSNGVRISSAGKSR